MFSFGVAHLDLFFRLLSRFKGVNKRQFGARKGALNGQKIQDGCLDSTLYLRHWSKLRNEVDFWPGFPIPLLNVFELTRPSNCSCNRAKLWSTKNFQEKSVEIKMCEMMCQVVCKIKMGDNNLLSLKKMTRSIRFLSSHLMFHLLDFIFPLF